MVKTEKDSGYRKCKIKTVKIVSSNHNALCDSPTLFSSTSNPGNMEPSDILAKCDEILTFRWIRFNMPQGCLRIPR